MTRLLLVAAAGTPIQDATCTAGDMIYVHVGANAHECGLRGNAHQKNLLVA